MAPLCNNVRGKENTVDTYLDIYAGDGDRALNSATIFRTWPAGTTDLEKLKAAVSMVMREGNCLRRLRRCRVTGKIV